jgi:succinate dehydrogenase flavin-adding protein (antitoxin of CptAB toxin-antitoxin module)
MKELDLVLQGWLDRRYPWASGAERTLFARFLELPDPTLACYLLGDEVPDDPALAALVAQLAPGGAAS